MDETLYDRLALVDTACCRLVQYRNTSSLTKKDIEEWAKDPLEKLSAFQVKVSGFPDPSDEFWFFNMGDIEVDIKAVSDENIQKCILIVDESFEDLKERVCPRNPSFKVEDSAYSGGMCLIAQEHIPAGTLIGTFHGYIRHMDEGSNEHYNASIGGSGGTLTVDPTLDSPEVMPEFQNAVAFRINESVREGEGNVLRMCE
mmetsp:Transcript_3271/g.6762  ORF Transcript_3271/g.6762 Transcript_3271/m.6762 type:complete len:200 (-) Transcript_3271:41-640(-)